MKKIKALLAILLSILLICAAPTSVIADELSHEDTIAHERIEPAPAKEDAPAPNNSEKDDPPAGDPEDDELVDESESSQSPTSLPETGNALPVSLPGVSETPQLASKASLMAALASDFVDVQTITDLPTDAIIGIPLTLSGTVFPENATNKTISWEVASANKTGAKITGDTLTTTAAGQVTVRAKIVNGTKGGTENFTKAFSILVSETGSTPTIVPVESIDGLTTQAIVGIPLTLSGTVMPANATNKTIVWSVDYANSTGAIIENGVFTATAPGVATIHYTIKDGSAVGIDFDGAFGLVVSNAPAFVSVTSITDMPTTATVGTPLTLSATVAPTDATNQTITWTVKDAGTTGASIADGKLTATAAGTVTVTATIVNGASESTDFTKDFTITVTAEPVKTHRIFLYVQKPNEAPFGGLNSKPLVVNDGEKLYTALADVDFSLYSADYTIETWFNYSTGAKFDTNTVVTEEMYAFAKLTPVTKYTICYRDGLDNAVFDMQSHTVQANNATPAFVGTPTRAGYIFAGWDPEVAPTVTADATYTAKWKAEAADDNDDNSNDKDDNSDENDVPKTGDRRAATQQATLLLSLACLAISLASGYKYRMSAHK